MDRQKLILVLIFILGSFSITHASEPGFDEVCKIYTEVLNSNMSATDPSQYVFDNVAKRVGDKDALTAHGVIYQAEPSKRYSFFKEAAEHSLKRSWSCAAMKELMK